MISNGCVTAEAASRIEANVFASSCSSLYAGTINEIICLLRRAISPVINRYANRRAQALLCSGVEQGIEKIPIFENVVLEASFESEAGFFKHARGCRIVRKHLCRDSAERKIVETEISNRSHHFSHDPASPALLAQPVTYHRGMPMHVLTPMNTDPADGCAVNLNAKFHFRLFVYGPLQEFVRILDRVRIREKIAYSQPDFAIVRVSGYRFGIIQPPRANRALLKRKFHSVLR